ncbi:MAG: NADH-quinone oxidoreductase subunit H [Desulfobacterales bacterium]
MMLKAANLVMLLIGPFVLVGVINRTKSFWAGRKGPPLFQFFFDIRRLLQKGEVVSHTASFVFELAPVISFASVILAGLLVPMMQGLSVFSFEGDFLLFSYILAVGRFFSIISAMDTGSSFGGMGASREALFSCLVEPAFFMMLGALGILAGGLSFQDMVSLVHQNGRMILLISLLCLIILFVMLLTEGCRVPVDDPNTHLELTMIHEVMVLDNSGPGFALMQCGAAIKMFVITSLMANLLIPDTFGIYGFTAAFVLLLAITAFAVGTIESFMARLRMNHVPQFILLMGSMSFVLLSVIALFFCRSV